MTRLGIRVEGGVGTAGSVGEQAIWTRNIDERFDGTSKLAILLSGHGAAGVTVYSSNLTGGLIAAALAHTGKWVCVAPQVVGGTQWGSQAQVDAIEACRAAGVARGCFGPKCVIIGYSEGGMGAGNYYKQHSDKLAAMVTLSGAVDQAANYGLGGHTPVLSPNYVTEIDAVFGSWAGTAGYRIYDEPASFRAKGVPWRMYHPTDDEVVPYEVATNHVAAVNDPLVTLRSPDITGGHTGFWGNIPPSDLITFLEAGNWS